MKDEWVGVLGFEDLYEVSSYGKLKRIKPANGTYLGRLLTPKRDRKGYLRYRLSRDCSTVDISAHKLVWTAFSGQIPAGFQINHLNGVRTDNRIENLEVCTQSQNIQHSYDFLRGVRSRNSGGQNGMAKLDEADVLEMRRLRAGGMKISDIAARFGLQPSWAGKVLRGQAWSSVA